MNFSSPTTETTFRVRYAETDQMGIVHHAAYVIWMEEGRSHWMRAQGSSYTQFEQEGLLLAVSELHIRYSQPARYDQKVTVRCQVSEVKSRQVTFSYEILDTESGAIFITGYSKHICLDRHTGKSTKIPDKWYKLLRHS